MFHNWILQLASLKILQEGGYIIMKKIIGNILSGVTFILGLTGLILYMVTMDITTTALPENMFYIFVIIGLVAAFITMIFGSDSGLLPIISAMTLFVGFMIFFNGQLGNLGYWVYRIYDIGDGLLTTFVVGEIVLLIAVIVGLISVFIKSENILGLIKIQK